MSEVLKWHREAANSVGDSVARGIEAALGAKCSPGFVPEISRGAAGIIAAHDPSAELLRECAEALKENLQMLHAYVGPLPLTDDDWTEEHGIMATTEAALARLKEAGVE